MERQKLTINPYLEVMLAATIWGTSGAFVKILKLNPSVISFFRMAVPTLVLAIYFAITGQKVFKKNSKLIFLASFLNAIRMFLYFVAFYYTSIGNAVIMLYTWPIFVSIFSIFFLKEKLRKENIISLFIAFSGIVLIYLNKEFSFKDKDFFGMTAMLFSAMIYSLSMIIFKFKSDGYSRLEITFFQNFIGSFIFFPALFLFKPFPSITKVSILIFYALFVGLLGFTLFFSALKKIKASVASNIAYVEIITAIFLGVLLFHEKLTWNMILGGVLIISSVWFLQKSENIG